MAHATRFWFRVQGSPLRRRQVSDTLQRITQMMREALGLGFVTMIFLLDSWLPARAAVM